MENQIEIPNNLIFKFNKRSQKKAKFQDSREKERKIQRNIRGESHGRVQWFVAHREFLSVPLSSQYSRDKVRSV